VAILRFRSDMSQLLSQELPPSRFSRAVYLWRCGGCILPLVLNLNHCILAGSEECKYTFRLGINLIKRKILTLLSSTKNQHMRTLVLTNIMMVT
jgi:hypothetical protein